MRRTALSGHRLEAGGGANGRGLDSSGYYPVLGPGNAVCQCGTTSEVLPSVAARRRWHTAHKDEIRAAGNPERGRGVHDDSPIPWRPPKGGKLRARLTAYAGRTGLPVNYIITEAVRCLLDAEAPQGDRPRPRPQPVPDQNTKGES